MSKVNFTHPQVLAKLGSTVRDLGRHADPEPVVAQAWRDQAEYVIVDGKRQERPPEERGRTMSKQELFEAISLVTPRVKLTVEPSWGGEQICFKMEDDYLHLRHPLRQLGCQVSLADADRLLAWLADRRGMVCVPMELAERFQGGCQGFYGILYCEDCKYFAQCAACRRQSLEATEEEADMVSEKSVVRSERTIREGGTTETEEGGTNVESTDCLESQLERTKAERDQLSRMLDMAVCVWTEQVGADCDFAYYSQSMECGLECDGRCPLDLTDDETVSICAGCRHAALEADDNVTQGLQDGRQPRAGVQDEEE